MTLDSADWFSSKVGGRTNRHTDKKHTNWTHWNVSFLISEAVIVPEHACRHLKVMNHIQRDWRSDMAHDRSIRPHATSCIYGNKSG
eukprot:scaffold2659_cov107-Cylindrotheca_fusiformis.AAC.17